MANDLATEQLGTLSPSEQAELPLVSFDATLTIGARSTELTFDVYGTKHRSYPGNRETPYEPSYIDVRRVLCNGRDATDLLNSDAFAKLFYDELYQR